MSSAATVTLLSLTILFIKENILIDETGRPRLVDFGLLTIISDPDSQLSLSTTDQGGTIRWMSPELTSPEQFGLERHQPTTSSDCYALGMVVYETIGGRIPFHEYPYPMVLLKVLKGEHPTRDAEFPDSLWKTLELCWASRPNERPSIENVLHCLQPISDSSEPHSPTSNRETEMDVDDWDSSDNSSAIQLPRGNPHSHPFLSFAQGMHALGMS